MGLPAPQIDGYVLNSGGTATSYSIGPLTTANANDVILLRIYVLDNTNVGFPTVSSITGTGLTWTKRYTTGPLPVDGTAAYYSIEEWYAIAASPLSAVTGTINLSGTPTESQAEFFGVSGADTSAPFDPNSSLPAVGHTSFSATPNATGISTTNPSTIILASVNAGIFSVSPQAGYTLLSGGSTTEFGTEYLSTTSKLSGASVGFSGTAGQGYVLLVDAIQAYPEVVSDSTFTGSGSSSGQGASEALHHVAFDGSGSSSGVAHWESTWAESFGGSGVAAGEFVVPIIADRTFTGSGVAGGSFSPTNWVYSSFQGSGSSSGSASGFVVNPPPPPPKPQAVQIITPAYLYVQYQDDPDLQAFVGAYNTLAQQYLDWFNDIELPIYTGLSGDVLDWVGAGMYDYPRPTLAYGSVKQIGPINTVALAKLPINVRKLIGESSESFVTTDDIYQRCLTWHYFKDDGKRFCIPWLKRRVKRFLIGVNGTAPPIDNTHDISITVSAGAYTITIAPSTIASVLQAALASGALETPFQYSFTVAFS